MCVSGANIDRVIFLSNRFILLSTKSLLGRCRFWNVLWFTRGASSLLSIDFESRSARARQRQREEQQQQAECVRRAECRLQRGAPADGHLRVPRVREDWGGASGSGVWAGLEAEGL